jgi:zinc-ribbon domain
MYCPRCGSQNTETTKFCRQCGLSLLEVTSYVATGGTSALTQSTPTPKQVAASFTPRQKMWLAILCLFCLPLIPLGISEATHDHFLSELIGPLYAILLCLGIPTVVMYFRQQAKLLKQMQTPPQPYSAPQQAYVQPQPQAYLQAPMMPVNAVPASDVPRQTPNTNPFAQQPASIIEDETKRLPSQ